MILAEYHDRNGITRAWGMCEYQRAAIIWAREELDKYLDESRAAGIQSNINDFTLTIREVPEWGRGVGPSFPEVTEWRAAVDAMPLGGVAPNQERGAGPFDLLRD